MPTKKFSSWPNVVLLAKTKAIAIETWLHIAARPSGHEDARALADPSANAGLQVAEGNHCRCSNRAATFAVFKAE